MSARHYHITITSTPAYTFAYIPGAIMRAPVSNPPAYVRTEMLKDRDAQTGYEMCDDAKKAIVKDVYEYEHMSARTMRTPRGQWEYVGRWAAH